MAVVKKLQKKVVGELNPVTFQFFFQEKLNAKMWQAALSEKYILYWLAVSKSVTNYIVKGLGVLCLFTSFVKNTDGSY